MPNTTVENQEDGKKEVTISDQNSDTPKEPTDSEIEKIDRDILLLQKKNELAQLQAQSEVQKIKKEAIENNKEKLKLSLNESIGVAKSAEYILSEFNPQIQQQEERLHSRLSRFESIQDRLAITGGEIKDPNKLDPYQMIPGIQIIGKPYNIFGEYASESSVLVDAPPIFKDFYLLEFDQNQASQKGVVLDNKITLLADTKLFCERVNQHRFLCSKNIKILHLSKTEGGYHEVEYATEYSSTLQTANNIYAGLSLPVGSFAGSVKKELNMSYTEANESKVSCKHTYINLYGLKLAIPLPKYEVGGGQKVPKIYSYLDEEFVKTLNKLEKDLDSINNVYNLDKLEKELKSTTQEAEKKAKQEEIDKKKKEWLSEIDKTICNFFDIYSPYFVGGIVMGGRSSIVTSYDRKAGMTQEEARKQTEMAVSLIMENVAVTAGGKEAEGQKINRVEFNSKFKVNYIFVGGDVQYGSCAMERGYARWATSVYQEPVFVNFLPDGLIPIWELLRQDQTKLRAAMKGVSKKWYEKKYLEKVAEEVNKLKEEKAWHDLVNKAIESIGQAKTDRDVKEYLEKVAQKM